MAIKFPFTRAESTGTAANYVSLAEVDLLEQFEALSYLNQFWSKLRDMW